MKVVILAGGYGSRLGEYTVDTPKPMVKIGKKPILWHIMKHFSLYGLNDFYLAIGYKQEVIKKYFLDYHALNSDFTVNLLSGSLSNIKQSEDWNVSLIDTGEDTMTGGRLKRLKQYLGKEPFLCTYGDGVSNVNIKKLIEFHKEQRKMVTITAVHPAARFGELNLNGNLVEAFSEKPQTFKGWVNGGFFVMEPEFLDYIEEDDTILERSPLEKVASLGELVAYRHEGFWQCMDTKRDKDTLEKIIESNSIPWLKIL
tara:strand:+ start:3047 stop:3814 length:768 start_codon:yes stop_codon:yes gene_type:complete